jgi:hypothetical protein
MEKTFNHRIFVLATNSQGEATAFSSALAHACGTGPNTRGYAGIWRDAEGKDYGVILRFDDLYEAEQIVNAAGNVFKGSTKLWGLLRSEAMKRLHNFGRRQMGAGR